MPIERTQRNDVDREHDRDEHRSDSCSEWPVIDDEDRLIDQHPQHLRAAAAKNGGRHKRPGAQREYQCAAQPPDRVG